MREIDKRKPVLVTGGSGYLASWIIKMLIEQGIDVHATVRDPTIPNRLLKNKNQAVRQGARFSKSAAYT
jgi:uncharacterized protein YbjT (DUF2867 family)